MERKPLKRHEALVALSRDHHLGLLLCWKIRTGLKKEVKVDRIKDYTGYFFQNHLLPHFRLEEEHIFSCLPKENPLRQQAEREHEILYTLATRLSGVGDKSQDLLEEFEKTLDKHIRFEERELFMHIQEKLNEDELQELQKRVKATHQDQPEHWEDNFWE